MKITYTELHFVLFGKPPKSKIECRRNFDDRAVGIIREAVPSNCCGWHVPTFYPEKRLFTRQELQDIIDFMDTLKSTGSADVMEPTII